MHASDFLRSLRDLRVEELVEIHGIGEKLARNLVEFTRSPRYEYLVENFDELETRGKGLELTSKNASLTDRSGALRGEVVVITGSFDVSRNTLKERLEAAGAKVTGAISKSTTLLLAGEKAGSKLSKAEKLGVKISRDYREVLGGE